MEHTIRFTSRANLDIRDHLNWQTANISAQSAEVWIQALFRQADVIVENPLAWPLARESQRLDVELREAHVAIRRQKTHRILFTVIANAVEIVAVRHVARADLTPGDLSN
jgi:plasmid stabilization system protein ParE